MKKTIQEIQADLKEKEKLSVNAQLQIKGGGCDDKRKGIDDDEDDDDDD